jgi:CDP-paratose 2-epimerase
MKFLITGGCGFLGSNLAVEVLRRNGELCVFDNLSRFGSHLNLQWLQSNGAFSFIHGDIRIHDDIDKVIRNFKPDVIFHLAGQVAMTTSIDRPYYDFSVNALGSMNVLEAARKSVPEAVIVYSSTNKVYGDLSWVKYLEKDTRYVSLDYPNGFNESTPLDFHSPYGCSKGAADQYMLDYARVYGLKTVVLRHSSMYGGRQFATSDQGWIGWFCKQALLVKNSKVKEPFTISGNGKQVRDLLHADDMRKLYFAVIDNIDKVKGGVFNVGGGMQNSLSLLELFGMLEAKLSIQLNYTRLPERFSDQKIFVADITKAAQLLSWKPNVSAELGIGLMLEWLSE